MATIEGTVDLPIDQVVEATRRQAAQNGYALAEGESGSTVLVLKKGMTWVSWGSQLTVHFAAVNPTSTRLAVTTGETFAITDWGRGRRATHKLLDAIGASY